jgi:hypothetical protein
LPAAQWYTAGQSVPASTRRTRDRLLRELREEDIAVGERREARPASGRGAAVEERHVVEGDRLGLDRAAPVGAQLRRRAEVDDAADPEVFTEMGDIGRRQPMERVAPIHALPPDPPSVDRRVAADVAEVEAALERDDPAHPVTIHDGADPCSRGAIRGRLGSP